MARRLLILGAGGHGRAVADLAAECGWEVAGFTERPGAPARPDILGDDADLGALARRARIDAGVVGVGNTALRRRAELFQRLRNAALATPALVHSRATVSRSATIGDGCVVFPHVVLGADTVVGENAVIYSGSVLEHGCRIGEHAFLAPGVILCGDVRVEAAAFVGAGAIVVPGVVIGKEAVVSAGARVVTDVPAGGEVSSVQTLPSGRGAP